MGLYRKKLRILIGIIKDTATITKSLFLTTKRTTSKTRRVVLRATTHNNPTIPPSETRVAAVLSLGHSSRPAACASIEGLMDRLHGTSNARVALKCLYTIHNITHKGSFILRDQLSFYPLNGGRNFLNMSKFRDKTDNDSWELSSWVRWYASIIEDSLTVSRMLGHYFSSAENNKEKLEEKVSGLVTGDLIGELEVLISLVELICEAPDTSSYSILQENNLVYEAVRLVSEDYGSAQKEILPRVKEVGDRVNGLSYEELGQVLGALKRLEGCKERLGLLFVNRKRNDAFWEMVEETEGKVGKVLKEKEEMKLTVVRMESTDNGFVGLTRFNERFSRFGPPEERFGSGGGRLMLAMNPISLTVSTAV